jgi:hydrogenase small subunit
MAAQTSCVSYATPVIWMAGQNCSGCQTSLLNRVVDTAGTGYYDGNQINALYGNFGNGAFGYPPFPHTDVSCGSPSDIAELNVVMDVADLLVGDAVAAVVPQLTPYRCNSWAPFPNGYIDLQFLTTVNAGGGDILVDHFGPIINAGGFVMIVDGTIPTGSAANEQFCLVFDDTSTNHTGNGAGPVTMADAMRWAAPQAAAILSVGTCSSYGGIPAAKGNRTGAMSCADFLAQEAIDTPVINVPGCPPHPDWIVYPVAAVLIHGLAAVLDPQNALIDDKGRPAAMYGTTPFCDLPCPNAGTKGTGQAAQFLGDDGCLEAFGCKGRQARGTCPTRQWNRFDDGTVNNWCVGAETQGFDIAPNIGHALHPCQGCIEPEFPDWLKNRKITGFYEFDPEE